MGSTPSVRCAKSGRRKPDPSQNGKRATTRRLVRAKVRHYGDIAQKCKSRERVLSIKIVNCIEYLFIFSLPLSGCFSGSFIVNSNEERPDASASPHPEMHRFRTAWAIAWRGKRFAGGEHVPNFNPSRPSILDAVDPVRIPQRILYTGSAMPAIGFGTFGSDHVSAAAVAGAVRTAAALGYRHFDCASVYGNEKQIGAVLADLIAGGIQREELWITSKVWNDKHSPDDVIASCEQSLADLQLDYLDMYLVHWPFPNFHAPHCDATARQKDARPYIHANYMKTWKAMEQLVQRGLVRHIGTSNMTIPKLELVLRDAAIRPAVNEMELHPHFQQPELFAFARANGVEPVGYCPIGSPHRPDRDRTSGDTAPAQDPVIRQIAKNHGVHPAVICLKWAVQRGQTPIPFSTNPANMLANLTGITEDPLSPGEMQAIHEIDRNCRLIKGHVFLWKEGQTWEDLWDINGEITPA
jgi:alcohol dehydrogenase (NADP+)